MSDQESEQLTVSKKNRRAFISFFRESRKKRENTIEPWRGSLRAVVRGSIAVTAVILAGTIIPYVLVFHGGLSPDHFAWGSFGGYVGGLFGPAFSLLSFVAVIVTLSVERRGIAQDARVAELRHELDTISTRLKTHRMSLALATGQSLSNDQVQRLSDWPEIVACLSFLSFCIEELHNQSDSSVAAAYYSVLYGKTVKELCRRGVFPADVFHPFRVHSTEPWDHIVRE